MSALESNTCPSADFLNQSPVHEDGDVTIMPVMEEVQRRISSKRKSSFFDSAAIGSLTEAFNVFHGDQNHD
jgi:hypothetical protein